VLGIDAQLENVVVVKYRRGSTRSYWEFFYMLRSTNYFGEGQGQLIILRLS
jgi:hypothetical protein